MGIKTTEVLSLVAGASSWFEGAQHQQVAAVIPPSTFSPGIPHHVITIPPGINKIIGLRAWALAYDGSAGPGVGGQIQNYNGVAFRDSAGVLGVWAVINFFDGAVGFGSGKAPPGIAQAFLDTGIGMTVVGNDLVINVVNNFAAPATFVSTVEWAVIDSPVPVT